MNNLYSVEAMFLNAHQLFVFSRRFVLRISMRRCAVDDVRMTLLNAVLSVADVYKEELTTRDRY